jgi:hypothetical protein
MLSAQPEIRRYKMSYLRKIGLLITVMLFYPFVYYVGLAMYTFERIDRDASYLTITQSTFWPIYWATQKHKRNRNQGKKK